ncbi:MAG: D-alanyl-D-alanine carboxypeptidase, partial [Clostridia bacterium]|nr:D-alanyl-D-alanine carboxypeptidase [Clostridia bacterium]
MYKKFALTFLAIISLSIGAILFALPDKFSASASAQSEIAMELTTGTVLTEHNADARLPMASTTKILTAIIIIEDCDLDEIITVPPEAVGVEGSSIYLKKDEQINIRDLLYGLMLRSGNDSATALAIHHSGTVEKFAEAMNDRAKQIGAEYSHFKNPSGLPDSEHYTTARDLCKIACYAMNNPVFKQIVSTANYTGNFRSFANKNKMLYKYEGANGVKTGYTVKAGRCLVSSAERNGMDVVCVVLNCPDMYERSCAIFDNCFRDYKLLELNEDSIFMCNQVLCKILK